MHLQCPDAEETAGVTAGARADALKINKEVYMPRRDGTGPNGEGPRTGRGMGRCGKGNTAPDNSSGNTQQQTGPGRGQSLGRGSGRGGGRGFGRGSGSSNNQNN